MPDLNIAGISLKGTIAEKIEKVSATLKIGGDKTSIVENKTLNIENVSAKALEMLAEQARQVGRLEANIEQAALEGRNPEALPAQASSEKSGESKLPALVLSVAPTIDLILGPGSEPTTFHLEVNVINGTTEPASLIYLAVKGPNDELAMWRQFVDVKITYRQPSETLRMPLPIQPKSTTYLCAQFFATEDLHLADKETQLRLEVLFAPAAYGEITFTVLGGDESRDAAKELSAAAIEKNVPAAYPIFIVPNMPDGRDGRQGSPPKEKGLRVRGS